LFSISAPAGGGLRTDERLSRGAVGLAGATAAPLRIWIEHWRLAELDGAAEAPGLALHLDADALELDLELHAAKPLITAADLAGPGGAQAAPFQFYTRPR